MMNNNKGKKLICWSLFDSGNGCYKKCIDNLFSNEIENYSIGLDIENKNNHFINLNLASYDSLFGENTIYKTLDKLPKPDIILASPPCEAFSYATCVPSGNIHFRTLFSETLFGKIESINTFTLRSKEEYETRDGTLVDQSRGYNALRGMYTRINGELCIINTVEIIKKYNPRYFVIENPVGYIWSYIKNLLQFELIENKAIYSAYDNENFSQKSEIFGSNIPLKLKKERVCSKVMISGKKGSYKERKHLNSYNKRSDIPQELINDILEQIIQDIDRKEGKK